LKALTPDPGGDLIKTEFFPLILRYFYDKREYFSRQVGA
jgi:hypothetical protein